MPRRHNTILHDRVALAAGATPLEKALPINPISFISIALRLLNNGANAVPPLTDILAVLSNVEVVLDGKTMAGGSLQDLAMLTYALWGTQPVVQPISKTDNNIINVVVHIPFGRAAWAPNEALPGARFGDLILRLTPAAAFTGLDTLTLTVEVRQILDSQPTMFLKYTPKPKTPTATGDHEVDLLTGPDYIGVLFFATTVPTAAAQTASIDQIRLLVDDVEQHLPATRWESLFGEWLTKRQYPIPLIDHVHISDLGAAYAQFQDTGRPQYDLNLWNNYSYLDFDPWGDGSYRLITRGRSRVNFLINAGAADLIRLTPVEMVPLSPAG